MELLVISFFTRFIHSMKDVGEIDLDLPTTLAILAILTAVVQAIYQRWVADARRDIKYEHRFTNLETKVELYWNSVEDALAKGVHSPHTPEADRLLEKIQTDQITLPERMRLRQLLIAQICELTPDPIRCTATQMLIGIQDARIAEAQLIRSVSPKVLNYTTQLGSWDGN